MFPPSLLYFDVMLVEGTLDRVVADLVGWMRGYKSVPASLNEIDYTYGSQTDLLWEPLSAPGKTAISRLQYQGMLGEKFGYRCITVRSTTADCEFPINELAVYEHNKLLRFVRVFRDDTKWDFYEIGDRLPFEESSRYRKRRIRDRVDRQLIIEYLKRLGWDILSPDFWETQGTALCLQQSAEWNAPTPCPSCGALLKTPRAKQCFLCGADWHHAHKSP